jgi:hypothetical protein
VGAGRGRLASREKRRLIDRAAGYRAPDADVPACSFISRGIGTRQAGRGWHKWKNGLEKGQIGKPLLGGQRSLLGWLERRYSSRQPRTTSTTLAMSLSDAARHKTVPCGGVRRDTGGIGSSLSAKRRGLAKQRAAASRELIWERLKNLGPGYWDAFVSDALALAAIQSNGPDGAPIRVKWARGS